LGIPNSSKVSVPASKPDQEEEQQIYQLSTYTQPETSAHYSTTISTRSSPPSTSQGSPINKAFGEDLWLNLQEKHPKI
jgi:hypothetical protein